MAQNTEVDIQIELERGSTNTLAAVLTTYERTNGERVELIILPEGGCVVFFCTSGEDKPFDSIQEAVRFLFGGSVGAKV